MRFNTEDFLQGAYMPKCEHPILCKNGYVPCGCCPQCLSKAKKDWITRLNAEWRTNSCSSFLTLTFDEQNIDNSGYYQVQCFLKRYRIFLTRKLGFKGKIKYFGSFERGDQKGRAHYHLIIFGHHLWKSPCPFWKTPGEFIAHNIWQNGFVKVEPLSLKGIYYVACYVAKKFDYKNVVLNRGLVDYRRLRYYNKWSANDEWCNFFTQGNISTRMPFYFMSKGIGFDFLWKNLDRIIKNKAICFQGRFYAIPRAFYKKIKEYDFDFDFGVSPVRRWIIEKYLKKSYDNFKLVDVPAFFRKYYEIQTTIAKRFASYLYAKHQAKISAFVHSLRP